MTPRGAAPLSAVAPACIESRNTIAPGFMQLTNTPRHYGWVARIAHWTSVMLVAWLYLDVSGLDVPPKVQVRDAVVAAHAQAGLALLALMCARLAWRWGNPNPVHRFRLAPWRRALALGVHRSLYVMVIGQCLAGLVALAASGAAVPLLGRIGTADTTLAAAARAWHEGFATALLLLVLVHAGAAIAHQIASVGEIAVD